VTCIVGLECDGQVFIGADSMAASGWDARETLLHKVFHRGEFLIGYTTSFRMGQLLEHRLEVAEQGDEDDMAYMVATFVEAVRELFKDNGFSKIDSNQEEGGIFLVGYRGRLYNVCSDFQVNRFSDGFAACGCGEAYALAALKIYDDLGPNQRCLEALKIAEYFCAGVRGPFFVEVLGA